MPGEAEVDLGLEPGGGKGMVVWVVDLERVILEKVLLEGVDC